MTLALLGAEVAGESAIKILKKDGVGNRDHHIREEAALALGRLGDPSGMKVLLSMLGRSKVPGLEQADYETQTRQLILEKVRVCSAIAKLGDAAALSALKKASGSKHKEVAAAATEATQAIESGDGSE